MYSEMENVIKIKNKKNIYIYNRQVFKHNYAKDAHLTQAKRAIPLEHSSNRTLSDIPALLPETSHRVTLYLRHVTKVVTMC